MGRTRPLGLREQRTGKKERSRERGAKICTLNLWLNMELSVCEVKVHEVGQNILRTYTEMGGGHSWMRLGEEMLVCA